MRIVAIALSVYFRSGYRSRRDLISVAEREVKASEDRAKDASLALSGFRSRQSVFDPDRQAVIHFPGHLMFYAPYATQKDVGAGPGAPFIVAPGTPHALMIVVPAPGTHGS